MLLEDKVFLSCFFNSCNLQTSCQSWRLKTSLGPRVECYLLIGRRLNMVWAKMKIILKTCRTHFQPPSDEFLDTLECYCFCNFNLLKVTLHNLGM